MNGAAPKIELKGKRAADPTFGGFKIPKMFFKVVVTARSGRRVAGAWIISQEDFLAKIDRLKPGKLEASALEALTEAEAHLYTIAIRDLEKLTGLDFGNLRDDQAGLGESDRPDGGGDGGPRPLEDMRDISL